MNETDKLANGETVRLSTIPRWEYMRVIMDLRNERLVGQYTLFEGKELMISKPNGKGYTTI